MPYIFGKLWHLAIIWAIRKAFQFILQGVRILLANHTRISPTSENDSYHNDNDNEDDDDDESPQGGLLWKSWGLVWYAVTEDATWISKSNISPCFLALSISLENQICCFLFFSEISLYSSVIWFSWQETAMNCKKTSLNLFADLLILLVTNNRHLKWITATVLMFKG